MKVCKMAYLWFFVIGLISQLDVSMAAGLIQSRGEFLAALMIDYDNGLHPHFESDNYTEVTVSLYINSIDSINENSMDYTINMLIKQEWTDERLQFFGLIPSEKIELDSKMMKKVWVPDLYFSNEKKAQFHDVTVPNRMLHLYETGKIVYRLRVSLTASCPMDLQNYPFDSQVCSLFIQSFAYTKNGLRFKWKDHDPVKRNSNMLLPRFDLIETNTHECQGVGENPENFTCIQLNLFLKRNLGFYVTQVYIPTILVVSLSWVSFWLNIEAVPARISLGILTVLTMTTQKTTSTSTMPPVSYVKAMDIWMAVCLVFVFAALLEYAFAYVMQMNETKQVKDCENPEYKMPLAGGATKCSDKIQGFGKRIDKLSRIIFPAVFLLFMVIYWIGQEQLVIYGREKTKTRQLMAAGNQKFPTC